MSNTPIFSLGLNNPIGQSDRLLERLQMAEDAGYDLFSIMDHPYAAGRHEAYSTLAFALGRTRSIGGYVSVTNLPLRPPAVLARTLSTLSALSGGRVVLGLGAGGYWDRIATMGVEPRTPGQAVTGFAEAIEIIHALTAGPGRPVSVSGSQYRVDGVAPANVPTPPIWTGSGGPRALAITGRLADGWIPPNGSDWQSQVFRDGRTVIDEAAATAGRAPAAIATIFNVVGALTDRDVHRPRGDDGSWRGGSAQQWIDELKSAVIDYGAGGFNVTLVGPDGTVDEAASRTFGETVVSEVREAVR